MAITKRLEDYRGFDRLAEPDFVGEQIATDGVGEHRRHYVCLMTQQQDARSHKRIEAEARIS